MATRKPEKKKVTPKKPVPKLKVIKTQKKIAKPPKKKIVKKPMKVAVKPKAPIKDLLSQPKDGNRTARSLLLDMRKKLISEISGSRILESLNASSEIGDLIDQAGGERDREVSLLLTDRDKEKLFAIDEALEKLKEGSYGICEECEDKIGQGRLKVMPLAKYCVNCQSKIEKEMVLQKKVEEELKYRGFASDTEEEEG